MTADENAALIRSAYEAFAAGDIPKVLSFFAPDIVWHIPGNNAITGDRHGPDEVMAFFGKLMEMSGGTFRLQVNDVLASDDHVVALCSQAVERNGQSLDGELVHVWTVSDGKATEFWGIPYDPGAGDDFWGPAA